MGELAKRCGWHDLLVMHLIASRLRKYAKQWCEIRQHITTTYPQTQVLQVAQFWKTVPFSRLFKEAALYEARYGQDFGDYCFQKLYKLRKLDIDMVVQILARNRHKVLKKTVLYTAYIILLYYCIILHYFVYHLLL